MQAKRDSLLTLNELIKFTWKKNKLIRLLQGNNYRIEPDENGNTALHALASVITPLSDQDRKEIFLYLIKNNVPLNVMARNKQEESALDVAIECGHSQYALMLMKYGATIQGQPPRKIVTLFTILALRKLSMEKNIPEYAQEISDTDLLIAELLSQLDINIRDIKNNTLLQLSITSSYPTTVLFLNHRFDLNHKNKKGLTALEIAAQKGRLSHMLLLLEHGAHIEKNIEFHSLHTTIFQTKEEIFTYALFTAIQDFDFERLNELLSALNRLTTEANPRYKKRILNARNANGLSALHVATQMAATEGNIQILQKLIDNGADTNRVSTAGIPPLFSLLECYHNKDCYIKIIELFVLNEFNVDAVDDHGSTLLHYFSINDRFLDEIRLLVSKNNINKKNFHGNTPLDMARYLKNDAILAFLLKAAASFAEAENMQKKEAVPVVNRNFFVPDGKAVIQESEVPKHYRCPITNEVMLNPVLCILDDETYEKDNIIVWLSEFGKSPSTGKALQPNQSIESVLIPNINLRNAIESFCHSKKIVPNEQDLVSQRKKLVERAKISSRVLETPEYFSYAKVSRSLAYPKMSSRELKILKLSDHGSEDRLVSRFEDSDCIPRMVGRFLCEPSRPNRFERSLTIPMPNVHRPSFFMPMNIVLNPWQKTTVHQLQRYGLRAEMLLNLQDNGHEFSAHHYKAFLCLILLQKFTIKDALSEMEGLSAVQAIGIANSLSRKEVLGLDNENALFDYLAEKHLQLAMMDTPRQEVLSLK